MTVSAVRLNSREYVRDRSTTNPENAIDLSSIRVQAYESQSSQPDVVHRSTTLDFGLNKSNHGLEAAFEIRKAV